MKQKIDPKDIREGDLIRVESTNKEIYYFVAFEYKALYDNHGVPTRWKAYSAESYYLLERPEPPFEPYWGMVIGEPLDFPDDGGVKAVYVPTGDGYNWFSHPEPEGKEGIYYFEDDWAKRKLAEGWVIINKPEGVK